MLGLVHYSMVPFTLLRVLSHAGGKKIRGNRKSRRIVWDSQPTTTSLEERTPRDKQTANSIESVASLPLKLSTSLSQFVVFGSVFE